MSVFKIRKTDYIIYLHVGMSIINLYTNKGGFYRIIERVKKKCIVYHQEDKDLDWVHYYCYVNGEKLEIARIEKY